MTEYYTSPEVLVTSRVKTTIHLKICHSPPNAPKAVDSNINRHEDGVDEGGRNDYLCINNNLPKQRIFRPEASFFWTTHNISPKHWRGDLVCFFPREREANLLSRVDKAHACPADKNNQLSGRVRVLSPSITNSLKDGCHYSHHSSPWSILAPSSSLLDVSTNNLLLLLGGVVVVVVAIVIARRQSHHPRFTCHGSSHGFVVHPPNNEARRNSMEWVTGDRFGMWPCTTFPR